MILYLCVNVSLSLSVPYTIWASPYLLYGVAKLKIQKKKKKKTEHVDTNAKSEEAIKTNVPESSQIVIKNNGTSFYIYSQHILSFSFVDLVYAIL